MITQMRKLSFAALALAMAAAACSSSTPSSDPAPDPSDGTATVKVLDSVYEPEDITVAAGTTVTWEWVDTELPHNVVADDGTFNSGDLVTEGSYSFTFDEAGTYSYHCVAHKSTGMVGTVTVS
jgi:plastocyanin